MVDKPGIDFFNEIQHKKITLRKKEINRSTEEERT